MRLKLRDSAWKKYDNKPGGGSSRFNQKWIQYYNDFYESTHNLKMNDFVMDDNDAIIELIYNRLHPKSSRYKFRNRLKNISDIPQRNTKIIPINDKLYLSIVYQITIDELQKFIETINEVREYVGPELTMDKYNLASASMQDKIAIVKNIFQLNKPRHRNNVGSTAYVELYKIGPISKILNILEEYNIIIDSENIIDSERLIFFLKEEQINSIINNIPWLIMDVVDGNPFFVNLNEEINLDMGLSIVPKGDEQLVGVIDSGFNTNSPLMNFVESIYDYREKKLFRSTNHGTSVSSLIIANDEINPTNSDGFGNFRVRHFEILEPTDEESDDAVVGWAYLYKTIEKIVSLNVDVKVWNLSLGGPRVDFLGVSPHGVLLDKLSNKYDCIFIIASGNSASDFNVQQNHSLNSPADSLNNISVGSVTWNDNKVYRADYSSLGYVLQNMKPDVSHFGGPTLKSGTPNMLHNGEGYLTESGTSFSAPKITRYIAAQIKLGFTPQESKAKLITETIKEKPKLASSRYGYFDGENNGFEINQTIPINTKGKVISEIIIPKNVEKIIITTSYPTRPILWLGHEAAIYEIKATLFEFNKESKILSNGTIRKYATGEPISSSVSEIMYKNLFEEEQRFHLGKYSTSKKIIYNWKKQKNSLKKEFVGIKIQRLDLHDIENSEVIPVSINVKFIGKDIDYKTFIQNNDVEIVSEIDVEIEQSI